MTRRWTPWSGPDDGPVVEESFVEEDVEEPRYSGIGAALIGLCVGLVILVVVWVGVDNHLGPSPSPAGTASGRHPQVTVAAAPPTTTAAQDIGAGFVFGKVTANDGKTLTVRGELNKQLVEVHTDDQTQVYVLVATTVQAILIGSPVLVYGDRLSDGSLMARTITGVSLVEHKPK